MSRSPRRARPGLCQAESGRQSRARPRSHGFGGFTLNRGRGGRVPWRQHLILSGRCCEQPMIRALT